jgi:uncharacterized protein (TIGR03067 family)
LALPLFRHAVGIASAAWPFMVLIFDGSLRMNAFVWIACGSVAGMLSMVPADTAAQGRPATPSPARSPADKAALIKNDYEALTGRWQLVQSVVNGTPVDAAEVRQTVLITDHDEFRFPADAKVGTAPLGKFTIDPTTSPKHVDSTALSGPDKGKVTKGIYEIIDANNKRACWGTPGGPRPTDFTSAPGSHRTVQYWRLISKTPGK